MTGLERRTAVEITVDRDPNPKELLLAAARALARQAAAVDDAAASKKAGANARK